MRNSPEKHDSGALEQSLVYGKNPVTELLKSGAGVDTVLLSEGLPDAVASYYTALAKQAGWRAEYLIDAARKVASGQVSEAALAALPDAEARALLMTVKGVGPKVADCVLLYSLSRWSVVPMDVWMKRAMARLFPRGAPVCCRPYQGIAQQFIFDYARASLPRGANDKKSAKPRRGD